MKKISNRTLSFIFTGVAIAGVVTTSTLSAMRAPKYEKILEGTKEGKGKKVKAVAKTYWPAFASGAVTIASIIFAKKLDLAEIATLTTTATFLAINRDKLEQKIVDFAGDEGKKLVREAKEEAIREVYICKPGPSVEETGRGDLLCFEAYSGRWFRSTEVAVERAIRELNDAFENGEYLSLNDFYQRLGIEETHFGHQFGWPANPDYYDGPIIFENTLVERHEMKNAYGQMEMLSEAVYIIELQTYPMECWMEV